MHETISIIANAATAIGVIVAVWQLFLARRQSVTNFEDKFAEEYRKLAACRT
jgi:ABC-type phosphate/phosphonate transport system permease subunit